jgi:hypothetical protein
LSFFCLFVDRLVKNEGQRLNIQILNEFRHTKGGTGQSVNELERERRECECELAFVNYIIISSLFSSVPFELHKMRVVADVEASLRDGHIKLFVPVIYNLV